MSLEWYFSVNNSTSVSMCVERSWFLLFVDMLLYRTTMTLNCFVQLTGILISIFVSEKAQYQNDSFRYVRLSLKVCFFEPRHFHIHFTCKAVFIKGVRLYGWMDLRWKCYCNVIKQRKNIEWTHSEKFHKKQTFLMNAAKNTVTKI